MGAFIAQGGQEIAPRASYRPEDRRGRRRSGRAASCGGEISVKRTPINFRCPRLSALASLVDAAQERRAEEANTRRRGLQSRRQSRAEAGSQVRRRAEDAAEEEAGRAKPAAAPAARAPPSVSCPTRPPRSRGSRRPSARRRAAARSRSPTTTGYCRCNESTANLVRSQLSAGKERYAQEEEARQAVQPRASRRSARAQRSRRRRSS